MTEQVTWAVVPARSGSRGFPDKNVALLDGLPLFAYSVAFGRALPFVDRVVMSTDSAAYAELGRAHGAEVPFLRGERASLDDAMEEHVLDDLREACERTGERAPDHVVWLRPTHPLRSVDVFVQAWELYRSTGDAVCVVTRDDPRLFFGDGDLLAPVLDAFQDRSMVRRQDCPPAYRIFGGEIFPFPRKFERRFLGERPRFVVAPDRCHADIDHLADLERLAHRITHPSTRGAYEGLVHRDPPHRRLDPR